MMGDIPVSITKNNMVEKYIDYKGFRYWYKYGPARDRVDYCLATKDPEKYCNGFFLYSTKDPGSGFEFVVTRTNNPDPKWYVNKH